MHTIEQNVIRAIQAAEAAAETKLNTAIDENKRQLVNLRARQQQELDRLGIVFGQKNAGLQKDFENKLPDLTAKAAAVTREENAALATTFHTKAKKILAALAEDLAKI